MSKALKKQMRQLEEEKMKTELDKADKQELVQSKKRKQQNMFAGFADFGGDTSSEQSEDDQPIEQIKQVNEEQEIKEDKLQNQKVINEDKQSQDNNKNEKQKQELNEDDTLEVKTKKKKKKKKKKKQKNKQKIEDEVEEKIEDQQLKQDKDLLEISKNKFNYNSELDKFFKGAKLVESQDFQGMSKKQRRMYQHQLKAYKPKKKYYLVHNDNALQKLNNQLGMKKTKFVLNKYQYFTFESSKKLDELQETFDSIRNTNDPNILYQFLMTNPYYPEALYAMAEYYRLQNNIKEANFMMEKLLFFYEESMSYDFKIFKEDIQDNQTYNILECKENVFNELFFKCILKFMVILLKRSCFQTAFQLNKLLLRLNPLEDPIGSLIMIDHTALKARKYNWLIRFIQNFGNQYIANGTSIILYPNFIFSFALSKFELEHDSTPLEDYRSFSGLIDKEQIQNVFDLKWNFDNTDINFYLILALVLYPPLFKKIVEQAELGRQNTFSSSFKDTQRSKWDEILKNDLFDYAEKQYQYPFLNIDGEQGLQGLFKVIDIYAERNKQLWKTQKLNLWLKGVCGATIDYIKDNNINIEQFREQLRLPQQEQKDILKQYTLPFEPKRHRTLLSNDFSDENVMEINNIPDDIPMQQQQNLNPIDANQNWLALLFNSLLPWNNLPQQNPQRDD